jgi:hypothetical protein
VTAPVYELRTHGTIRDLGRETYEALLPPGRPPFLSFAWLDALERTGCVGEDKGWLPQHISLHQDGECIAAAPAYVKTNSEGFAEAGGNAALVVADIDQKTTFLSLGARARFNAGEAGFQPFVSAAWNRAFDDRGAIMVSRFAAGGTPFGIIGSLIPKNSAEVEAGFDYSAGAFNIGAAYTGTLASDRNSHGVRVTARIAF